MIKRDARLILLNQTIAYKNTRLEFINFTDNLIEAGQLRGEDDLLGRKDNEDLPWSEFADAYHAHDRDALEGNCYGTIVPFHGANTPQEPVLCTRSPWRNEKGKTMGVFIHVVPIVIPDLIGLIETLTKTDPSNIVANYCLGKRSSKFQLTNKENECLFYLMRGKTTKFIAKAMNISSRTVEFHIDNLRIKFGCNNRNELISQAIQEGFLSIIPDQICFQKLNHGLS